MQEAERRTIRQGGVQSRIGYSLPVRQSRSRSSKIKGQAGQVRVCAPRSTLVRDSQGVALAVEGTVSERLTKGDHPRGVKVRLEDGRVGRVVSILR